MKLISSPSPQPVWHLKNQAPLFCHTENELCLSSWNGQRAVFFAWSPRPHRDINSGNGNKCFASTIVLTGTAFPVHL
jgi:hypothetical protein